MGTNPIAVYLGYDSRETVASYVMAHSIKRNTSAEVDIKYLNHRELRIAGHFARPWMTHGNDGQIIDLIDGKPFSTEFSHTRFLVPHLMKYKGWALFADADMIFTSNIAKLFELRNDKYAVMCVKHVHKPDPNILKMDGRVQTAYYRKNWSSFVLWNCAHPANAILTPEKVNFMTGRDMHAFSWLKDEQIGALPTTYNYISGVSPRIAPSGPDVIHYTEGGPWFDTCKDVQFADKWMDMYEDWQREGAGNCVSDVPTARYE